MKNSFSEDLLQNHLNFEEAKQLQVKYSAIAYDVNLTYENFIHENEINVIAGVDVSYCLKAQIELGVACAVFWNKSKNKFIESSFAVREINFPYKAGFLGFREVKVMYEAIINAKSVPDLLMCDGHGLIHPRQFGEAVHIGLALDIPSIGIAKNPYIGYYSTKELKRHKGSKAAIWKKNPHYSLAHNEILGYSICLADNRKPVFISTGYKVDIETAIKVALSLTSTHRQPEPLYLADKLAKEKINEIKS